MHGLKKENRPLSTLRTALGKVSLLAPQLLAWWVCPWHGGGLGMTELLCQLLQSSVFSSICTNTRYLEITPGNYTKPKQEGGTAPARFQHAVACNYGQRSRGDAWLRGLTCATCRDSPLPTCS